MNKLLITLLMLSGTVANAGAWKHNQSVDGLTGKPKESYYSLASDDTDVSYIAIFSNPPNSTVSLTISDVIDCAKQRCTIRMLADGKELTLAARVDKDFRIMHFLFEDSEILEHHLLKAKTLKMEIPLFRKAPRIISFTMDQDLRSVRSSK